MECLEFQCLLQLLWKDLRECNIPHHTKLHKLIVEAWYQYFDILKQDLAVSVSLFDLANNHLFCQNAEGNISCTTDLWSDPNHHPFIALTAYWIILQASKLVLKAGLIAFSYIPGSHDGYHLLQSY